MFFLCENKLRENINPENDMKEGAIKKKRFITNKWPRLKI